MHGIKNIPTNLSPRQRQVLILTAWGYRVKEIAERLGLKPMWVRNIRSTIYLKLQARSAIEAVRRARQLGLLTDEEVEECETGSLTD